MAGACMNVPQSQRAALPPFSDAEGGIQRGRSWGSPRERRYFSKVGSPRTPERGLIVTRFGPLSSHRARYFRISSHCGMAQGSGPARRRRQWRPCRQGNSRGNSDRSRYRRGELCRIDTHRALHPGRGCRVGGQRTRIQAAGYENGYCIGGTLFDHVTDIKIGTFRYLCVRAGHRLVWRSEKDSNRRSARANPVVVPSRRLRCRRSNAFVDTASTRPNPNVPLQKKTSPSH